MNKFINTIFISNKTFKMETLKLSLAKVQDLTYGIDLYGNNAIFIEESHLLSDEEFDFILCIIDNNKSFINLSSKFFRLIDKNGNQLEKNGWLKRDKIISWEN